MFSLTWLPEVLQGAGLKVAETPDWRTRGRAEMGVLKGVMCHHTATPKRVPGNMPTLNMLINGRAASPGAAALRGPLAQLGLGRDGTFYVVAAGRANHAGDGRWAGLVNTGNASFIGIEAENSGLADDLPWPPVQLDAYCRGVAALLRKIGAGPEMCCGHKEYATPLGRKQDPSLDMVAFRSRVASFLGGSPPPPPIAASDGASRPTLRRGSVGDAVGKAQGLLSLTVSNVFDAGMEAAVRRFQGGHALVADGIVGPATWAKLEPTPGAAPAVARAAATQAALPPPETPGQPVTETPLAAFGPDGARFASGHGPGFATIGQTRLAAWLASAEAGTVRATSSQKRVVGCMSVNEGGLEAVNSYDSAFMSFGVFQWTAGQDNAAGELAGLLARFASADAPAYADCFGNAGLQPVLAAGAATGFLQLNGAELQTAAEKSVLRTASWAYRFWRAGHHPALRACQAELAVSRIALFDGLDVEGRPAKDWITSELGVALLLDEHVNRPNHVRGTLGAAVLAEKAALPADPAAWTTAHEHQLILAYLNARRPTSMTDSDKRASAIMAFVPKGALSEERGSFKAL